MPYDWKKQDKKFYLPKETPELVTIPSFRFFVLDGKGNPNSETFADAIGVLYSLSYGIKMLPKKGVTPEGYFEYSVFPLEGVWDVSEEGKKKVFLDKNELVYSIMIRQPDFVNEELAQKIIEDTKKKKPSPLLENVRFQSLEDGLCVQMLHIGAYDDEPKSFEIMKAFCSDNNLTRISMIHREIYISDARKTTPEKLKTVLRFKVAKN